MSLARLHALASTWPPSHPPARRRLSRVLAAAIPDGFSNPGGPPFLEGASYSEDSKSVGYTLISAHHSGESNHSSFVFVNSLPEGLVVEAGGCTNAERTCAGWGVCHMHSQVLSAVRALVDHTHTAGCF
jgi:hypothetical protein